MNVLLYTLGCKLNQCESEAIADAFVQEGFTVVNPDQTADLCIINTCTVTGKAEQKARRMIRKYAAEPQQPVILVTGCYAQMERELLEQLHERVVVVSLDDKPSLLGLPSFLANRIVAGVDLLAALRAFSSEETDASKQSSSSPFDYNAATFSFHSRAFLKIQDGCDNACAYCRVTIARGDAKSLDSREVVRRALTLEQEGFSEIVLTGVNISAYRSADKGLGALLMELLSRLGQHMRVRLSSLEPDTIDEDLFIAIADPRVQPHFHLPIQSASNTVLKRVNRHYPVELVSEVIDRLRLVKDDPFIAADIITGLPAETEEEFTRSVQFVTEKDISQLHVFPFSPRPQTPLYDARDRVPEGVRDVRARLLRDLSAIHLRRYRDRQIGKEFELVLEHAHDGFWTGLTSNYLKVQVVGAPRAVERGDRIAVRLEHDAATMQLVGRYVSN